VTSRDIAIAEVFGSVSPAGVVASRASWFAADAWGVPVLVLPVVGGRTVWDLAICDDGWICVVEQPNFFGRFEGDLPGCAARTIHRWPGGENAGSAVQAVAPLAPDMSQTARQLAGRLRQVKGLRLPHQLPETPWFVVGLPSDAKRTAAALADGGFERCSALGETYPEFPGGMHIEVAWPKTENERFAQVLEESLEF